MDKLTVGELKQFIEDISDNTEVRISSLYDTSTGLFYHAATSDIGFSNGALVLEPFEIKISDSIKIR